MIQKLQIDFGGRQFSIETGKVARQANGSVLVQYGETVVLVTAAVSYTHLTLPTNREV